MFVGWDWASAAHDVTVLDEHGRVVDRWAFAHTEQALTATLVRFGPPRDRHPRPKTAHPLTRTTRSGMTCTHSPLNARVRPSVCGRRRIRTAWSRGPEPEAAAIRAGKGEPVGFDLSADLTVQYGQDR